MTSRSAEARPGSGSLGEHLVRALPFGFQIVAADGTILFQSEKQEKAREGAVGRKCWDVYRDDRTRCDDCPLARGLAEGETETTTVPGVLGGHTYEIHHTGITYEGQRAVLEIFQDVSQRERAEAARLSSEARLALVIGQVPAILWTVDHDLIFTSSGGAALAGLGLVPDQIIGMSLFDYFGTQDPEFEPILMHRRALQGGHESFEFEWQGNAYEVQVEPLRGHGETIDGCIGFAVDVTDRRRSEAERRRNEARYRAIVEGQTEFIVRWLPDGTRTFVNDAYCKFFGGTREEFLGTSFFPLIAKEDHPMVLEKISRLTPEHPAETGEHRVVTAGGSTGWQQWIDRGVFDDDGNLIELQSVGRDITERKRWERALRLTQFAVDKAADPAFWIKSDGELFYVNEAACDMLGYTADELRTLKLSDIDPNIPRRLFDEFWDDIKQKGTNTLQSQHRTRAGKLIPVEVVANYLEFDGVEYTIAFARDITERKRAEDALRRSEANYRGLVEHANYGIYRSSPEGRFVSVNPALVEMLGYDTEEDLLALDMERDVYAHPEERPRLVRQYQESGRIDGLELEWRRKDGSTMTVRVSGRPMHDPYGRLDGFEMIVEDVSERRTLEAQLRQAQKMEAIGQLTGGIAHDFNNLLSVITLNAQLVTGALEADQSDLVPEVQDIQEAARKAATMTKQLLGFSRHADLTLIPTDLARVVSNLSSMMRRVLPENIRIRLATDEAVPAVRADAGAVEQMLLNLATNARDAMPEGGVLRVGAKLCEVGGDTHTSEPWVKPGSYVHVYVDDSGTGMDESTKARVFEPFFTTKAPGVGTGLGMAMVYGLTKQHNGFVTVDSTEGQGTTVRLYFPVVQEEAEALPAGESLSGVRGGSETILLVEDEDTLRRSGKRVLERYGYRVLVASDGQEGLEIFRANPGKIDLIVSDLVMPKMGGGHLHRVVREEGSNVKFILASGYTGREDAVRDDLDPSLPILQKPWLLSQLLERVRETLDAD